MEEKKYTSSPVADSKAEGQKQIYERLTVWQHDRVPAAISEPQNFPILLSLCILYQSK